MAVDFINPYTWVPFVSEPTRGRPAEHGRLGTGRLSGRLRLQIRARTPLLIGGLDGVADPAAGSTALPRRVDGTLMIPGSALHGAVRSVHEALTGSCLRVLDADYVPVHRHSAAPSSTRDLEMAVVTDVDDGGLPTEVVRCGRTVGIDLELLGNHADAPLCTGDRLVLPESKFTGGADRDRLLADHAEPDDIVRRGGMTTDADASWVLLVTDIRERNARRFVAGKVNGQGAAVSQEARDVLQECLAGADDLRPASRARWSRDQSTRASVTGTGEAVGTAPGFVDVTHKVGAGPLVVGRRLRVTERLHRGQPVWVRVRDGKVVEVRLSQLWRRRGEFPVAERVRGASPCTDPDYLCPSCRLFGSAGADNHDDDDAARQRSYRGHVRVEDAVAVGEVGLDIFERAPLSAPRPSAGQFYLDNSALPANAKLAGKNDDPAAFWGSVADHSSAGIRPIRGRKFYWRTNQPTARDARGRKRGHHSSELTKEVEIVQAGAVFTTIVSFDNLSPAQLGGLVAALDPRLLWPDLDVVMPVGGGKPFGFGSVNIEVTVEQVHDAASRYLGRPAPSWTLEACIERFRGGSQADSDTVPPAAAAQWDALRNALTLGFVADDAPVWYPPGSGARGSEEFDEGFDFWKETAGIQLTREVRPLVWPPSPAEGPERQVIHSEAVRASHQREHS